MVKAADTPARVCLLVLCGLPAAGKSSLARALADTPQPFSPAGAVSVQVVHFDGFLHQALGKANHAAGEESVFTSEAWQASRQHAMAHVQSLLQCSNPTVQAQSDLQLEAQSNVQHVQERQPNEQQHDAQPVLHDSNDTHNPACRRSCLVVLDDTMHYTSMRYDCWRMARAAGAAYAQVYLDCPPDIATARNAARSSPSQRIPDEVMERMIQVMCVPEAGCRAMAATSSLAPQHTSSSSSSAWEAPCTLHLSVVATQTPQQLAASVWAWLGDQWQEAVPPPNPTEEQQQQRLRDQQATSANQLHQLDKQSRLQVAHCMQAAPKEHRRVLAGQLHEARQKLLERARACLISSKQHSHTSGTQPTAVHSSGIVLQPHSTYTQRTAPDGAAAPVPGECDSKLCAQTCASTTSGSTSGHAAWPPQGDGSVGDFDGEDVNSLLIDVDVHLSALFQQFCSACRSLTTNLTDKASGSDMLETSGSKRP